MRKPSDLNLVSSETQNDPHNGPTTLVLTNQETSSSLPSPTQVAALVKSPILYENDFDLYLLLKDMITNQSKFKREKKQTITPVRSYTKSLTAHFDGYHECDGLNEWEPLQNGYDMYQKKLTNCIGTNLDDFDYGDPISLDLQPLSTRIKLMCKLVIINQGACLERNGPPKLVQDRCIQFDSDDTGQVQQTAIDTHLLNNNIPIIKSNSCENLTELDIEKEQQEQVENKKKEQEGNSIKITISSSNSQPVKRTNSIKRNSSIKRANSIKRSNSIVKPTNNASLSDDECIDSYVTSVTTTTTTRVSSNSKRSQFKAEDIITSTDCDLEHYSKHRISKLAKNDYASAPYYQYSCCNKESCCQDKSTQQGCDNDQNNNNNNKSMNVSTSTDDLLDSFSIGYYSKYQLLSSQSLFEKKSSLKLNDTSSCSNSDNESTTPECIDLMSSMSTIPIKVNIKNMKMNKINENDDDDNDDENDNTFIINVRNDNPMISEAKISIKIPPKAKEPTSKISSSSSSKRHRILDDDDDVESLALLKAGPKRSSEWSIFKNKTNSSLIKSTTTTTTTTTTKTTKTYTDNNNNNNNNNCKPTETNDTK